MTLDAKPEPERDPSPVWAENAEGDADADAHLYPEPLPFTPDPGEETFAAAAPARIKRLVPILAVALAIACWPLFGWRNALGFAVGATIAAINYRWLEGGISALFDRIAKTGNPTSGAGTFFRFFLRFGLVLSVAYATLDSYPESLYGFLAGLFVPAAAILLEAFYQVVVGLRGRP